MCGVSFVSEVILIFWYEYWGGGGVIGGCFCWDEFVGVGVELLLVVVNWR